MWKVRKMQMPKPRFNCPYCERPIASTAMRRHKQSCPKRLSKAPIQELTYGEAKKAGRLKEFLR